MIVFAFVTCLLGVYEDPGVSLWSCCTASAACFSVHRCAFQRMLRICRLHALTYALTHTMVHHDAVLVPMFVCQHTGQHKGSQDGASFAQHSTLIARDMLLGRDDSQVQLVGSCRQLLLFLMGCIDAICPGQQTCVFYSSQPWWSCSSTRLLLICCRV